MKQIRTACLEYTDASNSSDRIVKVLAAIWELRDSPIRGIKGLAKISNEKLSRTYGIPIHTIENWLSDSRGECPKYVWQMLAYCVFSDFDLI